MFRHARENRLSTVSPVDVVTTNITPAHLGGSERCRIGQSLSLVPLLSLEALLGVDGDALGGVAGLVDAHRRSASSNVLLRRLIAGGAAGKFSAKGKNKKTQPTERRELGR